MISKKLTLEQARIPCDTFLRAGAHIPLEEHSGLAFWRRRKNNDNDFSSRYRSENFLTI